MDVQDADGGESIVFKQTFGRNTNKAKAPGKSVSAQARAQHLAAASQLDTLAQLDRDG